jgi:hypothetical protein
MDLSTDTGLLEEQRLFYVAATRARDDLSSYTPLRMLHYRRAHEDKYSYAPASRFLDDTALAALDLREEPRLRPPAKDTDTRLSPGNATHDGRALDVTQGACRLRRPPGWHRRVSTGALLASAASWRRSTDGGCVPDPAFGATNRSPLPGPNRVGHVLPGVPWLPLGVPRCPENASVFLAETLYLP